MSFEPALAPHFLAEFDVAVIGAGASGALVAAQFSRQTPAGARLALIGNSPRPARGVAYETPFRANLLNVASGKMSAFPEDPEHFVRWLAARLPGSSAQTFAPRQLYGAYLAEILAEALQNEAISLLDGMVIRLEREAESWTLHLADGAWLRARTVVLALGNLLLPGDPFDPRQLGPCYFRNPWEAEAVRGLDPEAPVLLVGTGLTMVDVALSLRESGHRGQIQAVSRHGRLYQFHQPYTPRPLTQLPADFSSPQTALRWLRAEAARAENWRAVIDSLRPHTVAIWQGWTLSQRASFLRHARNLWDLHRHRMAPEIAAQLNELLAQGALTLHAGRILQAESNGQSAQISLRLAHSGETLRLDVDRVINCTGPARDFSRVDHPLIANLRQHGWLVPDALGLGLETDPVTGQLLDDEGRPTPGLFTLGPLRIPALWESLAIPEIRVQAADLAKRLAAESAPARLVLAAGNHPHGA